MPPQKNREPVSRRTIHRSLLGLIPTFGWCLSPNTAHAELPHYRIELAVPQNLPKCNREADFIGMVLPMLAKPVLDPLAERVIVVRIAKNHTDYLVDVIVNDPDGKTLEEEHVDFSTEMSCHEVLYRAAIRASVQLNKRVNVASAQPPPPPPPPPVPPPKSPPVEKHYAPTPKPFRHLFVGLGGLVEFGMAPETLVGAQFVGGWRWPAWSAELNAAATLPQDTRPWGPTVVHLFTAFSVGAAPCYRRGSFGVCGLVAWSRLWFERRGGTGYEDHSSDALRFGLRGFMEQRIADRWSVRVDLDVATPAKQSNISNDAEQVRWTMPHVTGAINATVFSWF